jgi:hypothetical protein
VEKAAVQQEVEDLFRVFMEDRGTPVEAVDTKLALYEQGYGLDSMDTATLSAMLADRFEKDPYSNGKFPGTVDDIIGWYAAEFSAK